MTTYHSIAALVIAAILTPLNGAEKPIKVYILAGQSNMVGIGQVKGKSKRWSKEFTDGQLSTYEGKPDAAVDYDTLQAKQTMPYGPIGGVAPPAFPKGTVVVLRGQVSVRTTGIYNFRPGYGASEENIMVIDGKEVYHKEPGSKAIQNPIQLEADKKVAFKITYLNDEGEALGWYERTDVPGNLMSVVGKDGKFKYLTNEKGEFAPRDDVWYTGVVTATANKWLDIGCGSGDTSIGPELGFGHKVGNFHDEPVLILKASEGNRSLGWDFLPPGSERFEHTDEKGDTYIYAGYKESPSNWLKGTEPKPTKWYGGKQYDQCFGAVKEVLSKFDENYPQWKGRGYEIAGFGWWQGHKDGGEQGTGKAKALANRYEKNLAHLINTLRKEFNAPNAPFVVASCGFNGGKGWQPESSAVTIFNAQMNVSDATKYPDFKGNVKSVDTRSFYRAPEISPRNQSFHYNGNAETYMLVGEAMGNAMVELQKK